jgi:prephenate dehydrogenase
VRVSRPFERVTIAGVGLIGGSLALAARHAGLVGEVVGLGRTQQNLDVALSLKIVDRVTRDPRAAVRDADLVVLAVPVATMAALAGEMAPALRPGTVVIDVGSVKTSVVRDVPRALPSGVHFVGTHPIAGTEESGAAAARADLFRGTRCVLTPTAETDRTTLAKVRALWEGVGATVEELAPERHDEILAWVSHLPHALAFSAINALLDVDATLQQFAGPSCRDLTRVAASSTEMWSDIFLANAAHVDAAITKFIAKLDALRRAIASGDRAELAVHLARARAARRQWGVSS